MASGERESILADFQACTQLDDIETSIAILDQNDWNLMAVLRDLHLPKENTLFLLTPDLNSPETSAGPSASMVDNLNRTYNLKITNRDNGQYNQITLKFSGTKTIWRMSPCVLRRAERDARESIRTQQDVAYQESLEVDRKKREAKEAEERELAEIQQRELMRQAEEESKRMEEEALKQAIEESLAREIPDEPPEGCKEVTCMLRIRAPEQEMLMRKFYGKNKLQVVINYITSKGFHLSEYKLLTTFPRRDGFIFWCYQ
ncbi:FAF1-like protein [Mya arenaria]|uniref:FAF1-like protein n=1 Tax=Mya arenaria TaxID=6604 RepID=A0ABY7FPD5_MYAAR|nr:FAF1-like protein [Mya arenaria]